MVLGPRRAALGSDLLVRRLPAETMEAFGSPSNVLSSAVSNVSSFFNSESSSENEIRCLDFEACNDDVLGTIIVLCSGYFSRVLSDSELGAILLALMLLI